MICLSHMPSGVRVALARVRRRTFLVVAVVASTLISLSSPPVAAQEAPSKEELIKQLENYYVEMYSEPLRARGRLPKLLAIMSLSKIQCDRTNGALIELLENKDKVVRYLAWESLHTRHTNLSPEQRLAWAKSGATMAANGDFPGATLVAPLRLLASLPRETFTDQPGKIMARLLKDYSPEEEADLPVLDAGRDWVSAWRAPALVDDAKDKLKDGPNAAWYLLEPLAKQAAKDEPLDTKEQRRKAVDAWLKSDGAKYDPAQLVAYTELGQRLPPPKVITDPNSDEFRKELEIGKLDVDSIDVCWVVDATGSMYMPNQVIASQTAHFAAVLSVLSDRVRFGVAYYRHEMDPKIQVQCCGPAGERPYYQVKVHPLTSNIPEIVRTMLKEPIPEPNWKQYRNTHPGSAVAGGMQGAIKAAGWIDEDKGKRVMVLVGDAEFTPNSEAAVASLIKQTTERKFIIHALLLGKAAKLWPEHIKGTGTEPVKIWNVGTAADKTKPSVESIRAFRTLERTVLLSTVSENYHNRIDPLLAALKAYIDSVAGV